ncbi:hypothetical protein RIF29_32800 [Crotalaria pallida]|uniref:Pectinesterase inhibitor domain-containing protein n=1 Tax=Crotalaria pallida TaxID=3830 RepID=A0AAN9EJ63_CROPI
MEIISYRHLMTSTLVIILASSFTIHSSQPKQVSYQVEFIRTSCSSTTYPRLCFNSLVKHAYLIQSNRVLLTGTALNVTLASAKSTSAVISTLSKSRGLKPREVAAMSDCVEELSDTVDELRRSIDEMSHLRTSNFELTMSDVQTWVSAALTDESTCTDGFQETAARALDNNNNNGDIKTVVRGKIVQLAQLTSNALALINQLASHG